MSLPVPESERKLSSLKHSQGLGRLSALSLLLYFGIGPCVNITMFGNEDLPSLVAPVAGVVLILAIIANPKKLRCHHRDFTAHMAASLALTA